MLSKSLVSAREMLMQVFFTSGGSGAGSLPRWIRNGSNASGGTGFEK